MKNLHCLIVVAIMSSSCMAEDLSIQINPQTSDEAYELTYIPKNLTQIFGGQGNLGIRKDLEEKVKLLGEGYKERTRQLLVHSRAHDLYMAAQTPDEAYNSYLLMKAAQKCLSTLEGVGERGASSMLFDLATAQINTDVRRQAVVRSEYMLSKGDFPAMSITTPNAEYCKYTQQPIFINKELTKYLTTD